ncbi:MAG: endonuclease/exonuclease/phosphatase family protein [Chitinophagales bacterium]
MFGILKFLLKILVLIVLSVVLILGGLVIHASMTDYQPEVKEILVQEKPANNPLNTNIDSPKTLSFLLWNMGYGGLGKESDFFYDGGKMVHPETKWVEKNMQGITQTLKQYSADFVLLQEVDKNAQRSSYNNQLESLKTALPNHFQTFATNYLVDFIPIPFENPLGGIHSGIATYSRFEASENIRFQFPGNYDWPQSVYMLDRCFLFQRFNINNSDKQLIVINSHNSAYDKGGKLKKRQMEYLKDILVTEYEKGNYVIAGADWNQVPPDFDSYRFVKKGMIPYTSMKSPKYYPEAGWQWIYDGNTPTNRALRKAYSKDSTFTTVIDYFLLSPNIKVKQIEGINLDFEYSDHQPVRLEIELM